MNVIKLIRPGLEPVKLIRPAATTIQLIRPATTTVRLVNEKGVVIFGGAADAALITVNTDLSAYYRLQKQL